MNISIEEIIVEFKRHVRLCQGIGRTKMISIINEQFSDELSSSLERTNEHCVNPNGFDKCNYVAKDLFVCKMRKCKFIKT